MLYTKMCIKMSFKTNEYKKWVIKNEYRKNNWSPARSWTPWTRTTGSTSTRWLSASRRWSSRSMWSSSISRRSGMDRQDLKKELHGLATFSPLIFVNRSTYRTNITKGPWSSTSFSKIFAMFLLVTEIFLVSLDD